MHVLWQSPEQKSKKGSGLRESVNSGAERARERRAVTLPRQMVVAKTVRCIRSSWHFIFQETRCLHSPRWDLPPTVNTETSLGAVDWDGDVLTCSSQEGVVPNSLVHLIYKCNYKEISLFNCKKQELLLPYLAACFKSLKSPLSATKALSFVVISC